MCHRFTNPVDLAYLPDDILRSGEEEVMEEWVAAAFYNPVSHCSHNKAEGHLHRKLGRWRAAGPGSYSPHVCKKFLKPLLPIHRPELEPGCGVAGIAQTIIEGPVVVESQAEAGFNIKEQM